MNKSDLELLGYSSKWVDYGFLTPELLTAQVAYFHTSDDQNTEHYRYAAFQEIQRRSSFSDGDFERYVDLATSDPDPSMARAALIDLLSHPGVTQEQREVLYTHPWIQDVPKLVKRQRLMDAVRSPDVTLETLHRCVNEGDSSLHRTLVERPELPRSIVEALHQRGANKKVRNIAGVRLKRGQYQ